MFVIGLFLGSRPFYYTSNITYFDQEGKYNRKLIEGYGQEQELILPNLKQKIAYALRISQKDSNQKHSAESIIM